MLFSPTFAPFNFHWYEEVVPALAAVALNVTVVPGQNVFPGSAAIVRVGLAFTVIVTSFDAALVGFAQASDEVITQVTLAPLVNAAFW